MARKAKVDDKNLSSSERPADKSLLDREGKVVLTEKRIDSVLQVSKGQKRVKAVVTPPTQTVTQCADSNAVTWSYERLRETYERLSKYDSKVAAVFDVLFSGGCRVSEVLNVNLSDIDNLGKVTLRSLKGGDVRVVQCQFAAKYLLECKTAGIQPFAGLDRFYVYRVFKNYGVSAYYGNNERASVTHLPRHEVALASKEAKRDKKVTSRQLGQKSEKSTEHYTDKERGETKKSTRR